MQLHNALALASIVLAGPLVAQPNLTFPDDGLQPIGTAYAVTSFTTTTPAEFPPAEDIGADEIYGFWMLQATGNYDRHLLEPSVTTTSGSFPGTTVLSTNGGQDTSFYKVDADGIELLGVKASLEGLAPYTNGALELKLPCTFGTTWSDAFSATYTVSTIPVNRAGTIVGVADGYGTLQLPAQQFEDVLQVKVRKVQVDQSALINAYRSYETHYYFQSGIRYPLMKTSLDTVVLGSGAPTVTFTAEWLYGESDVSISNEEAHQVVFTPYPNPTSGMLDLRLGEADVRSIEVFDATGKILHTRSLRAGEAASGVLDLTGLSAGVYQVQVIQADGRRGARRVVVQ